MRHLSPEIADQLAADYVLGTMSRLARTRFEAMLKVNPQLRKVVATWEGRLTPMASSVPDVAPPPRVWQAIHKSVSGSRTRVQAPQTSWWTSLGFWRSFSATALVAVLALALTALQPEAEESVSEPAADMMVVVMEDTQTHSPAMTVSWESGGPKHRVLRLRVIGHAEMAPDTAWELWMMPRGDDDPISLGLITTHELQHLRIPKALAQPLDEAWGLGMTVEPKGGSPNGLPTGPMLYKGACIMA